MTQHLVVLGNSAAALAAVRAVRAHGGDARITLVSREECNAYSPVLTTYYLRDQISEDQLFLCDAAGYRALGVECRLGIAAVEMDGENQTVILSDGARLSYDHLLIATGASPRKLGGDLEPKIAAEVCYLRTLADARRIRLRAAGARHVAVFGGGLVGLQVASALARPNRKVTCVVASQQILSQNVDAAAAAMLSDHVQRVANIEFLFGADVAHIERGGEAYRVVLSSGSVLAADLLVAGKGVEPSLEFIDRNHVHVDRGVVVNCGMRTNSRLVYAAGDVAQARQRLSRQREPVTNWINAIEQGRIAGANLAGCEVTMPGAVPENITTLFGAPVACVGITRPAADLPGLRELVCDDPARGVYRKLLLQDGRLIGAVLLRDISDVGVIRRVLVGECDPGRAPEEIVAGRASYADALRECIHRGT